MVERFEDHFLEWKGPAPCILFIEDDVAHIELIRRSFGNTPESARLVFSTTLKEARVCVERETPDLIIADWLLPDGKGIDILPRKDGVAVLPFIVMTSHGDEKLAVEMMKSGAIDYIVKSDRSFRNLPRIVRRVLREWGHITEQNKAEEALRENEIRLAKAAELAKIVDWEYDIETGMFTFNDHFYALYGTTVDREGGYLMPADVYTSQFIHPDDVQRVADAIRNVSASEDPRLSGQIEHRIIRRDGDIRYIIVHYTVVMDADGSHVKNRGVNQDITERISQEKALALTNQKLQLMNIVAWHDIQNKLTGLRGYVELSKDLIEDKKVIMFLAIEEDILRTIDKQIQYTREYQDIGKQPPRWIQIPDLIRMTAAILNMASVRLEVTLDDLELHCDPIIEKVFSYLIWSTLEYGEMATAIRISSRQATNHLMIIYEDDGVGIPIERKKSIFIRDVVKIHAFSMFFIHDILEISDMSIEETGVPGKGARFEIRIPKGRYRFGNAAGNQD